MAPAGKAKAKQDAEVEGYIARLDMLNRIEEILDMADPGDAEMAELSALLDLTDIPDRHLEEMVIRQTNGAGLAKAQLDGWHRPEMLALDGLGYADADAGQDGDAPFRKEARTVAIRGVEVNQSKFGPVGGDGPACLMAQTMANKHAERMQHQENRMAQARFDGIQDEEAYKGYLLMRFAEGDGVGQALAMLGAKEWKYREWRKRDPEWAKQCDRARQKARMIRYQWMANAMYGRAYAGDFKALRWYLDRHDPETGDAIPQRQPHPKTIRIDVLVQAIAVVNPEMAKQLADAGLPEVLALPLSAINSHHVKQLAPGDLAHGASC